MEFLPFGESLRNIRKRAGLSQKELASGICSQAQISKIEKNDEIPSALILNEISKKLGVDMNYFFEIQQSHKLEFINQIKDQVWNLKKQKKYSELQKLIIKTKRNPLFQDGENLKFLIWHEAICLHYVQNESKEAVKLLKKGLQINPYQKDEFYKEIDIQLINSLAILQKELKIYDKSEENFKKAYKLLKHIPKLTDNTIELRRLFGLAQLYTETGRFEESIKLCQKGISLCDEMETLYLLGNFQYQTGENHAKLGNINKAKQAFNKACLIYQLQDNVSYVKLVKENEIELLGEN
ncbi:helix-turn-helix domain-containing protein [Robertmurraya massiliosenegalensis]|uniref:helix-turn-helix domain-containing protein n=1 Tax=Robertmurraya massiliosenegalensis TaxID=1287657 RepID=UPI0003011AAA|nr:helix-turn-helix domain-containing protein [Robertmurraya massiliosenegalensis]